MKAYGKYYKTILRDEATAETEFEFTFLNGDDNLKQICRNGLMLCRGRIPVWSNGIPLSIEGEVKNNCFIIHKYSFWDKSAFAAKELLQYLTGNELTCKQEEKIIEQCNNDVLLLIKNKSILESVLSKSKKKKEIQKRVYKKLKDLYEQEKLTRQLLKYGVELNKIEILHRHEVSYEQYQGNPYLISIFHSISIYQADQFAFDISNVLPYELKRLCGFVMDAVVQYRKSGHSCVKVTALCKYVNMRLRRSVYPETRINLPILNFCIVMLKKYIDLHVLNNEIYIYENHIWEEETEIVAQIERLNKEKKEWVMSPDIPQIERNLGITYNRQQKEAFDLLRYSGVKILTGPPGSGKTAIIKGLIMAMETAFPERDITVKLSATTGRAAQVMSASSQREAETVNKMLEIRPYGDKIHAKNQNDPIEAELIIVDEVSMLGTKLAASLLSAVKTSSILILVGDENQLQSVEYGNVLQDLIQSRTLEICKLNEIMRQSGAICENALKINTGNLKLIEDKSFQIHECSECDVKKLLYAQIRKSDIQIISSVKKGELGTMHLNQEIQKRVNRGQKICLIYKQQVFFEHDKVIMTETNYVKGYFNGDIGEIIGKDGESLLVQFGNKCLSLDKDDYHVMELAYVITTHKSQGSEFSHVHVILPRSPENMLTRRILYTAVTRAKVNVHIYSIDHALEYAIKNIAEQKRLTMLSYRLSDSKKRKESVH